MSILKEACVHAVSQFGFFERAGGSVTHRAMRITRSLVRLQRSTSSPRKRDFQRDRGNLLVLELTEQLVRLAVAWR